MRELVEVDGHFKFVDAVEEILEHRDHVGRTLRECLGTIEHLTGNACARFGGSAQTGLIECGRFHHCVERFGVISLPRLVARLDLNFAALRAIQTITIFAPKNVVCYSFEFILIQRL
jgi:hypothetical protein